MRRVVRTLGAALPLLLLAGGFNYAFAKRLTKSQIAACIRALHINVHDDHALGTVAHEANGKCHTRLRNGYPIPDPACTPGAYNSTLTLAVMKDRRFRTGCVRNQATSEEEKGVTYHWYRITKPAHNIGAAQTCELDHFISLELGGADTLDNIWPQCGPGGARGIKRYFKQKDTVENYLASQVRAGKMPLRDAQQGIARDWTQYLDAAKKWEAAKHRHRRKKQTARKRR